VRASLTPEQRQTVAIGEQWWKGRWARIAALLVLLLAITGAVFLFMKPPKGEIPVVVFVDTTAAHGIYDETNRLKGITNTEELKNVLSGLPLATQSEQISINWTKKGWRGVRRLIEARPDLITIHRSSFFHPVNEELQLGYPPFANDSEGRVKSHLWSILYPICDNTLISFLGN